MHLHRDGKWCLSHLPGNDCFISHYCSNKGSKQTLMKSFKVNGYPFEDDLSGSKAYKKRYEKDSFRAILSYAMLSLMTAPFFLFSSCLSICWSESFNNFCRIVLDIISQFLVINLFYFDSFGFEKISRNETHPFGFKIDILRWDWLASLPVVSDSGRDVAVPLHLP